MTAKQIIQDNLSKYGDTTLKRVTKLEGTHYVIKFHTEHSQQHLHPWETALVNRIHEELSELDEFKVHHWEHCYMHLAVVPDTEFFSYVQDYRTVTTLLRDCRFTPFGLESGVMQCGVLSHKSHTE